MKKVDEDGFNDYKEDWSWNLFSIVRRFVTVFSSPLLAVELAVNVGIVWGDVGLGSTPPSKMASSPNSIQFSQC